MSWGLLLQIIVLLISAIGTVGLFLLLGPLIGTTPGLLAAFLAVGALFCGLAIVGIVMAVIYLVGFHGMYSGRHEYGPMQDRMMDRALVFVIIAIVLSAVQAISPFSLVWGSLFASPSMSTPGVVVLALVAQPASALFAGLALLTAVTVFADGSQRTRLLIGMILGAVGAAAGTAILLVAGVLGGTPSSLIEAVIASALAGQGTSVISLLVFFLVYREIHHKLETGMITPAVPTPPPIWPYYYYPPYAYPAPAPQAPAVPPSPPSPPPSSPPKQP
ncbi:MAG: hypothetical protein AABX97_02475 [Candidatus Thermoplasmatota archaeon]